MMNKPTRKLSKIPEEVRGEIGPYFTDLDPVVAEDGRKLPKIDDDNADCVHEGLTPKWSDLDVNQHVNNVKYIGWILESAPQPILESHELAGMTLEYRRECGRDSVLQSLTAVSDPVISSLGQSGNVDCQHLLDSTMELSLLGEGLSGGRNWLTILKTLVRFQLKVLSIQALGGFVSFAFPYLYHYTSQRKLFG